MKPVSSSFLFSLLGTALSLALAIATSPRSSNAPTSLFASRFYAGSPRSCRLKLDCAPWEYCPSGYPDRRGPAICTPRRPANATCWKVDEERGNVCAPGFFCHLLGAPSPQRSRSGRCVAQPPVGAPCSLQDSFSCGPGRVCDFATRSCRAAGVRGGPGARCLYSFECDATRALYCRGATHTCARQKASGAACLADVECAGFCRKPARRPNLLSRGVCAAPVAPRRLCLQDSHCVGHRAAALGADRAVCNGAVADGTAYGVCARYSTLVKRLGARCSRHVDLCDRARGLVCRWNNKFKARVCQLRFAQTAVGVSRPGSAADRRQPRFCRVRHPLSFCPGERYIQCRRMQRRGHHVPPADAPDFPACLPARQRVPLGASCRLELAKCPHGTQCRPIPGVLAENPSAGKGARKRALFCVRVLKVGDRCRGSKFKVQCGDKLACRSGVCVRGKRKHSNTDDARPLTYATATHADLGVRCDRLPCAPGLQCPKRNHARNAPGARSHHGGVGPSAPVCVQATEVIPLHGKFVQGALRARVCARGLAASEEVIGGGAWVRTCRRPYKAGLQCVPGVGCEGRLRCRRVGRSDGRRGAYICQERHPELRIGAACDPGASERGKGSRCVATEAADAAARNTRVVRCLPRGRAFRCQVVANLFQSCDAAKNIACDHRLRCTKKGVCVQR